MIQDGAKADLAGGEVILEIAKQASLVEREKTRRGTGNAESKYIEY